MKTNLVQIVLLLLVLIVGCTAEDLLPKFLGVGFPVLLAVVQFLACRGARMPTLLFAVAAGGVEDSLAGLPLMTSVSFFLAVVAITRWSNLPRFAMLLTYPFYQLWLNIWSPDLPGNVFGRILIALVLGFVTAWVAWGGLVWLERKAAVNEQG